MNVFFFAIPPSIMKRLLGVGVPPAQRFLGGETIKRNIVRVGIVSLDWWRMKDPPLALGHASIKATLQAVMGDKLDLHDIVYNVKEVSDPELFLKHASSGRHMVPGVGRHRFWCFHLE